MGIGGMTPAMKLKTAASILRLDPIKIGGLPIVSASPADVGILDATL
jgi:hypothetical protein